MSQTFDDFVKYWRERYRWPLTETRASSEKRIIQIENQMRNRILRGDPEYIKEDLSEIILWKAGAKNEPEMLQRFEGNTKEFLTESILKVVSTLSENPADVTGAINTLIEMKGVGIPVASAFLRFMDPETHRYGVIDSNVALFLNQRKVTNFNLREGDYWIKKYPETSCRKNIQEYQKYHNWIQLTASELRRRNVTFRDLSGRQQPFSPVDIDMAIFAYMTQTKSRL
jgi:hypothetical protein